MKVPRGYTVDYNHVKLGQGLEAFSRAAEAIRNWKMCCPEAPIEVGTTVAVLVYHFAFWSLDACRIVYRIEEDSATVKFGFAYGTLSEHEECGEERFMVEWHRHDDSVWYDLLTFSRPNHFLSKLGYPRTRQLQRRFPRDSMRSMLKAESATCLIRIAAEGHKRDMAEG